MAYDSLFKETQPAAPITLPEPDDTNPALLDAYKTFKITAISAALFVAASIGIILMTRMG
jgi:hypothetical protein